MLQEIVQQLNEEREQEQSARAIYQVSQIPGFQSVIGEISEVAKDFYCMPPIKPEDQTKWETFCVVRYTVETILQRIGDRIEEGARLTQLQQAGEPQNENEDGHNRVERRRV